MPTIQEAQERFFRVKTALQDSSHFWRQANAMADEDDDTWVARFMAAIAVCLDVDDEIAYATSDSKIIDSIEAGVAILYTKTRLVYGSFSGRDPQDGEPASTNVVVVSRDSLLEVRVGGARNPAGENAESGLVVAVVYASESIGTLALPQGTNGRAKSKELAAFLPSLLADLDS